MPWFEEIFAPSLSLECFCAVPFTEFHFPSYSCQLSWLMFGQLKGIPAQCRIIWTTTHGLDKLRSVNGRLQFLNSSWGLLPQFNPRVGCLDYTRLGTKIVKIFLLKNTINYCSESECLADDKNTCFGITLPVPKSRENLAEIYIFFFYLDVRQAGVYRT